MTHFKSVQFSDNSKFELIYENGTAEEVATAIEKKLGLDRYIIKKGELGNRTYVKGNRVLRLLLGAFYKYFEFNVVVKKQDDGSIVAIISKTSSGMSGGLIGVNQVKKELKRLEFELQEI